MIPIVFRQNSLSKYSSIHSCVMVFFRYLLHGLFHPYLIVYVRYRFCSHETMPLIRRFWLGWSGWNWNKKKRRKIERKRILTMWSWYSTNAMNNKFYLFRFKDCSYLFDPRMLSRLCILTYVTGMPMHGMCQWIPVRFEEPHSVRFTKLDAWDAFVGNRGFSSLSLWLILSHLDDHCLARKIKTKHIFSHAILGRISNLCTMKASKGNLPLSLRSVDRRVEKTEEYCYNDPKYFSLM
jgi:hypothetical protein